FTTLNFFGEIPFLGSFRWLQQWLGQSPTALGSDLSTMRKKIVLLGNLPESVLVMLQQHRPDLDFDSYSGFSVGDSQSPKHEEEKLRSHLMTADTVIIADDVLDFSSLIAEVKSSLQRSLGAVTAPVFDFTQQDCDVAAWGALDDVVMGGVSQGSFRIVGQPGAAGEGPSVPAEKRYALFSGQVSTENSGGFSSVRTRNFEPPFNFDGWAGVQLRVKGDGQRYKFIARNSDGWDSPAYIYSFDTVADEWTTVNVAFADMVPTFRARSVPNAAPFNASQVHSFQLMLSKFEYDRRLNPKFEPGSFALSVSRIAVYRDRQDVPVIVVGAMDEANRGMQQSALADAQVPYRFIEPGETDLAEALVRSLS
ncbi:MAG: CIA30 family protein, partial [Cyanobacteria bacterium J06632_3]